MIENETYKILIIDNNKDFNNTIFTKLVQHKFDTYQVFDGTEALEYIKINKNTISLVVLNIDYDEITTTKIFHYITKNSKANIILLSSEDTGKKREKYFAQGILDYHLIDRQIDHIVDDISETIYSLDDNRKETIVIIDNSELVCNTVKNILEKRNYTVLTATSVKDGLEILKNNEITLLILDMEISDIKSLDLLAGLRDMYVLNDFFVLVISKKYNPSLVRDALKGGAKDFLKKPFLYEEFVLKIDILINTVRIKKTIIDQKKQIENNLKIFKELLDSSIGAMFIFEKNICVNCNNESIELLGYTSKNDILNKEIFDIFTDISNDNKKDILDNRIDHYFEDTIISKDSKVYQIQFKERNLLIDNKILKIIVVLDVSDVKRKEKILSEQTKMASMGEMIGNIAHQWRQPLSAISIAAGGIKLNYVFDMEDKDETIVELDNIVANTQFLSSTIESFQNFLKADKITTKFEIHTTLKKTLTIIHANLKSNNIKIVENYSEHYSIRGIENELVQVFLNIINNSADILKTLPELKNEKFIIISTQENDTEFIITIQDNAHGIPDAIINKIFEPYFTTKHQAQGTGLGLYMSHQIIEQLGGNITAQNEEFSHQDQKYYGAKFIISFPTV
jgi:signal transduction histidine kinase/DNA-binding response OmpR family regulator